MCVFPDIVYPLKTSSLNTDPKYANAHGTILHEGLTQSKRLLWWDGIFKFKNDMKACHRNTAGSAGDSLRTPELLNHNRIRRHQNS